MFQFFLVFVASKLFSVNDYAHLIPNFDKMSEDEKRKYVSIKSVFEWKKFIEVAKSIKNAFSCVGKLFSNDSEK